MDRRGRGDKAVLKAFLCGLRGKHDPADFGLPPTRTSGSGRRAPGLTQDNMDQLTGHSSGTYGRFEGGRPRGLVTAEYLESVARILQLTREQWTTLWHLVYGHQPPHTLDPEDGMSLGGHWGAIVRAQTAFPCYVNDLAWNLLASNQLFDDLFPEGIPPHNTMEWMVLSPYARTIGLPDWQSSWARMVLPQLRAACNDYPDNPDLAALERRVTSDPVAGPLYASTLEAYHQPDGNSRPLWHAGQGRRISVTIAPATPFGAPGARLTYLVPDYVPGPPLRRAVPPCT
ncbi:XRE family transcriptional regulator [Kitasatospora sp. NPDC097605]|uniref:MmyB family transcriptional regulator n=1 Tax=Kitasatospora sp. NPDC097605 TaxID=3157226 RepID=UPI00331D30F7